VRITAKALAEIPLRAQGDAQSVHQQDAEQNPTLREDRCVSHQMAKSLVMTAIALVRAAATIIALKEPYASRSTLLPQALAPMHRAFATLISLPTIPPTEYRAQMPVLAGNEMAFLHPCLQKLS
jgi:hypothetical protein